jgi:hypothetical protein
MSDTTKEHLNKLKRARIHASGLKIVDYTHAYLEDRVEWGYDSLDDMFTDIRVGISDLDFLGMIWNEEIESFYKEHNTEIGCIIRTTYENSEFQDGLVKYKIDSRFQTPKAFCRATAIKFALMQSFNYILDKYQEQLNSL